MPLGTHALQLEKGEKISWCCTNGQEFKHAICTVQGTCCGLRDAKGQPLSKARLVEEFAVFFIAGLRDHRPTLLPGPCKLSYRLTPC